MEHLRRRAISFTVILLGLPALLLALPFIIVVGGLIDLVGGLRQLPTVRLALYALVYLVHEWVGLIVAAALRLAELTRIVDARSEAQFDRYRRMQAWWSSSLLDWARRLLNVRFDLDDLSEFPENGFIVLSRHASMVDAVLPAVLVSKDLKRYVHYVLKQELQWDPNLDVYGHRLGNYFVSRDGDGDSEADAIGRFALTTRPRSATVIFPEGTYATPGRQERIRASLARRGEDELLALATELRHLLPPKPAGTLALLDNRPDHDVVVMGHVGLEGVTDAGLRHRLPLRHPVTVRWWVHPRSTIPATDEERIAWLNEQWRTLDRWVASVAHSNV